MQTYYANPQTRSIEVSALEVLAWIVGVVSILLWGLAAFQGIYQFREAGDSAVLASGYVELFINRYVLVAMASSVLFFVIDLLAALSYIRRK